MGTHRHTPGQAEQDVDREADEPDAFLRWRLEAQLPTEIPASREQLKNTAPGLRCLRLLLWRERNADGKRVVCAAGHLTDGKGLQRQHPPAHTSI